MRILRANLDLAQPNKLKKKKNADEAKSFPSFRVLLFFKNSLVEGLPRWH